MFAQFVTDETVYQPVAALPDVVQAACAALCGQAAADGQPRIRYMEARSETEYVHGCEIAEVVRLCTGIFGKAFGINFGGVFVAALVVGVARKDFPIFVQLTRQLEFRTTADHFA